MAKRWHINEKGETAICDAQIQCRLGSKHFDTELEAKAHYSASMEANPETNHFANHTYSKKKSSSPAPTAAEVWTPPPGPSKERQAIVDAARKTQDSIPGGVKYGEILALYKSRADVRYAQRNFGILKVFENTVPASQEVAVRTRSALAARSNAAQMASPKRIGISKAAFPELYGAS